MIADTESPPGTEELLQQFHNCRFLTSIDLVSFYWQIPLETNSRKYTAFLYNVRSYVYNALPFGLKTAVASFSRCMDLVLGTETRAYTHNYIDDLLIASASFEEHVSHLSTVLYKLKNAGMTINLAKTLFVRQEVPFLRHILIPRGMRPDPSKIEGIQRFAALKNLKGLRGFLGLCNYYRRFTRG